MTILKVTNITVLRPFLNPANQDSKVLNKEACKELTLAFNHEVGSIYCRQLKDEGLDVYEGSMITVLGTSLQNRDILEFFYNSTWKVIGLEMEGAHYQKAIQSASKIRGNVKQDIEVRYAYYASDNPLETGSTLASGGLGASGVKPTYLITQKILEQIF